MTSTNSISLSSSECTLILGWTVVVVSIFGRAVVRSMTSLLIVDTTLVASVIVVVVVVFFVDEEASVSVVTENSVEDGVVLALDVDFSMNLEVVARLFVVEVVVVEIVV